MTPVCVGTQTVERLVSEPVPEKKSKPKKKAAKATKKAAKAEKGEKVKKPLSGYMLFCKHNREAAKKKLPSGLESKAVMPAVAKVHERRLHPHASMHARAISSASPGVACGAYWSLCLLSLRSGC